MWIIRLKLYQRGKNIAGKGENACTRHFLRYPQFSLILRGVKNPHRVIKGKNSIVLAQGNLLFPNLSCQI